LKCRPLGGFPLEDDETVDVGLNGTGVSPNTSTCYVYVGTFKLLPHSLGQTVAGSNKAHIALSSIDMIIKPDEQEMLQTQLNSSAYLREIDDVIKEISGIGDRAQMDVTAVLEKLRQVELIPDTIKHWATGISIGTLLILTICCCYYKQSIRDWIRIILWKAMRQRPIPHPQQRNKVNAGHTSEYASTVDTVLPLNVVAIQPSGEEQEEPETELNEDDRVPTPFVSRGRVPAL
jgi:hypothetical protein